MVKQSESFCNREKNEIKILVDKLLSRSLLFLHDEKWKDLRETLNPIFTSSKSKKMFELLVDCMEEFIKSIDKKATLNGGEIEIDTHDTFARVIADSLSTTVLGIKGDSIKNDESEIFKIAKALEKDFSNPKAVLKMMFPEIISFLGMQVFGKKIHDFFNSKILNEINQRRLGKTTRSDFIQLLVQCKNLSEDDLVSQAMVLFLLGFETTTNLMQAMSFELATNLDIQETLIKEVDEMLRKLNGKSISCDQLNSMKYLEMVINETLRKWPSSRMTCRCSSAACVIKDEKTGKEIKIKKGLDVWIHFGAIQMDPKYFPNPEKFDPTRFSKENKAKIVDGSFLPFGLGPRNCLGMNFALIKVKFLLFAIMSKFKIKTSSKTPEKLFVSKGFTGFADKIYVNFKLRK
jgi:cytochrome P450 family 9